MKPLTVELKSGKAKNARALVFCQPNEGEARLTNLPPYRRTILIPRRLLLPAHSHHARCEPIGRTSLHRHLPYWHTAVELTVYHWIRIHSRIASSVCALVSLPWHCETSAELAASVIPSGVVR